MPKFVIFLCAVLCLAIVNCETDLRPSVIIKTKHEEAENKAIEAIDDLNRYLDETVQNISETAEKGNTLLKNMIAGSKTYYKNIVATNDSIIKYIRGLNLKDEVNISECLTMEKYIADGTLFNVGDTIWSKMVGKVSSAIDKTHATLQYVIAQAALLHASYTHVQKEVSDITGEICSDMDASLPNTALIGLKCYLEKAGRAKDLDQFIRNALPKKAEETLQGELDGSNALWESTGSDMIFSKNVGSGVERCIGEKVKGHEVDQSIKYDKEVIEFAQKIVDTVA